MGQGAHLCGAELVNLEKEGKLVPVDQVETTWLRTLMFLRTKLLALPSKLAARLSLCTGIVERQKVLREAIDELLVDFATTEVVIESPMPAGADAERAVTANNSRPLIQRPHPGDLQAKRRAAGTARRSSSPKQPTDHSSYPQPREYVHGSPAAPCRWDTC